MLGIDENSVRALLRIAVLQLHHTYAMHTPETERLAS
jgi:hypothetical protein